MTSNGLIVLSGNVAKNHNVRCFHCKVGLAIGSAALAKYRHGRLRRHYCTDCAVLLNFVTEHEVKRFLQANMGGRR
jgi:hypothetical protein